VKQFSKSAVCMQLVEDWFKAGEYWYLARKFYKAGLCFDKAGDSGRAGQCYLEANDIDKAVKRNVIIKPEKLATFFEGKDELRKAAKVWEESGQFEKAALDWRQCRAVDKEAHCWELAGRQTHNPTFFFEAERCYKHINQTEKARQCRLEGLIYEGKKWNEAGQLAEGLKDLENARMCYGKAINLSALRRIDRKISKEKRLDLHP
jgi:tetratricopeptide (TPR) repeat protein